ncbi:MAG: ATP synthase F1 subunit gamma [Anaerolineae bacterium]|nr:ATP synthase F1 subunit gamma [Anaerolineae bacterium]MCO5190207.1 ATP synthase F1 subunit gamma [Anaerolineae bacterium]MCO5192534.1 ATP synthase F1 subunit gamma [Anaerolineae bacterium]MCO5198740.1 ATP synthase F1 subunit gamma [Anaerolineae bacterium]MCO5203588.1 ATP synthase F1 subunit gamma [Anaerolineae bacterium]
MATELELRKRIRSVKNISKVTNALSAVSASKARRAERQVRATRDYAGKAFEILNNLAAQAGGLDHPLLTTRDEIKAASIVLITGDRGLAGAYNTNIIRLTEQFAHALGVPVQIVSIGRKGRDLMVRRGYNVVASFTGMPTTPTIYDITPVAKVVTDDYLSGKVDEVFVAYTDYVNLAKQVPVVKQLLPLKQLEMEGMAAAEYVAMADVKTAMSQSYTYEPEPQQLLNTIVPRFTELQLYQSLLESIASEESARFMAMQNATDNAMALVEALTLERNKVRQTNITNEILDIVGGAEALAA